MLRNIKGSELWSPDPTPDEGGSGTIFHSGRAYCGICGKNVPEDLAVYGSLSWGQPFDHYCRTCVPKSFVSLEDYQASVEYQGF